MLTWSCKGVEHLSEPSQLSCLQAWDHGSTESLPRARRRACGKWVELIVPKVTWGREGRTGTVDYRRGAATYSRKVLPTEYTSTVQYMCVRATHPHDTKDNSNGTCV